METDADLSLTIGALARAADIHVETVRYYQRIGLIEEPRRPARGYRRYPAALIDRIHFIKRAQQLGFTLHEIGELLSLNACDCNQARHIAEQKHAEISQRLVDLEAMQRELARLIEGCRERRGHHDGCAIIDTLRRPD